jgi:hypothetical protein
MIYMDNFPKPRVVPPPPPRIGVVIPTTLKVWHSFTSHFVHSLMTIPHVVVMLVVNNVKGSYPSVQDRCLMISVEDKDFNFSRLNNIGRAALLERYNLPWIVYANDDLLFFDERSVREFGRFPDCVEPKFSGARHFSGVIYHMNGSVQRAGGRLHQGSPQTILEVPDRQTKVELMGGPFHIVASDVLWDENLPVHLNDDDISLRCGGSVIIPTIRIKHQMNTTTGPTMVASPKDWQYFRRVHGGTKTFLSGNLSPNVSLISPKTVDLADQIVILQTDHIGDHAFTEFAKESLAEKFPHLPLVYVGGSFMKGLFDARWSGTFLPLDYRDDGGCRANIHPIPPQQMQEVLRHVSPHCLIVSFRIDGSDMPVVQKIPHSFLAAYQHGDFSIGFDPSLPISVQQEKLVASIPRYLPVDRAFSGSSGEPVVHGVAIAPFSSIPPKEMPLLIFQGAAQNLQKGGWDVWWIAHGQDRNRLAQAGIHENVLPDLPLWGHGGENLYDVIKDKKLYYVGCDSGPSHWAVISGIPTLIVHPPQTNPTMLSCPSHHLVFLHSRSMINITANDIEYALSVLHVKVREKMEVYRRVTKDRGVIL